MNFSDIVNKVKLFVEYILDPKNKTLSFGFYGLKFFVSLDKVESSPLGIQFRVGIYLEK
jgi:hypothetical protein